MGGHHPLPRSICPARGHQGALAAADTHWRDPFRTAVFAPLSPHEWSRPFLGNADFFILVPLNFILLPRYTLFHFKHFGSVFTCARKHTLSCFSWNMWIFKIFILLNGDICRRDISVFPKRTKRKCQCRHNNLGAGAVGCRKHTSGASGGPKVSGTQRGPKLMWHQTRQFLATNFKMPSQAVCMLSHFNRLWLFVTPRTVALQAPLSMGFSCQECWCG